MPAPCRLAILLAPLLLPIPAAAQQGTGATVAPRREAPQREAPQREAPRAPGLAASIDVPATLLRLAAATLGSPGQAGRGPEVLELLERAESRLLTRSELASRAGIPRERGVVGEIAAARAALAGRDRDQARFRIGQALAWLDEAAPPVVAPTPFDATGPSRPAPAAEGGGQPARYAPLPGIAPQDMPVGGTASPPVPIGPDADQPRAPAGPGDIPPSSTKAPAP